MRKLDRKLAGAMVEVLARIFDREGSTMPSHDVQLKAMKMLERGETKPSFAYDARVYKVRDYVITVNLTTGVDLEPARVLDAECSCPATTTCSHLLATLTMLEQDGHHLET